jgi:ParB-like chromosome segregation protein Spo0J
MPEQKKLTHIRLDPDKIWLGEFAVRQAQTDNPRFKNLVESLGKTQVLIHPIRVCPLDPANFDRDVWAEIQKGNYEAELVVGCQRTAAAKVLQAEGDPNWQQIDAILMEGYTRDELKTFQIHENTQRIPMTKTQKIKEIIRLMSANPDIDVDFIAQEWAESTSTIRNLMNLNKLHPTLQEQAAKLNLPLTVCYKLVTHIKDQDEQLELMKEAIKDDDNYEETAKGERKLLASKVIDTIVTRGKDLAKIARGKEPEFHPKPKVMKWDDVDKKANVIAQTGNHDFAEGMRAVYHMDEESIKNQEKDWLAKQAERRAKKTQEQKTAEVAEALKE